MLSAQLIRQSLTGYLSSIQNRIGIRVAVYVQCVLTIVLDEACKHSIKIYKCHWLNTISNINSDVIVYGIINTELH